MPPPPWISEGGAREGGTIWLNNCQNTLKTRLKITLKVDFYIKNKNNKKSDSGPHRIFSGWARVYLEREIRFNSNGEGFCSDGRGVWFKREGSLA